MAVDVNPGPPCGICGHPELHHDPGRCWSPIPTTGRWNHCPCPGYVPMGVMLERLKP